jgi:ribosomal protein S18 acetylase RimI-like enzyme
MSTSECITVVVVDDATREAFLAYALEHGPGHDDSYLAPEDIAAFDPATEPAALAYNNAGSLVGVASVMVDGYITQGLGRFRVLHATEPAAYLSLLTAIREYLPEGMRDVFLFLPEEPGPVADELASIGFAETRRAYVLKHTAPREVHPLEPPSGTHLEPAMPSVAEDWAHVGNAAFHGLPGRYDMTAERAAALLERDRLIRDGTLIAWRSGMPAGIILTIADADDPYSAEIETLAVTQPNQGIGLGRTLLHSAVASVARTGRLSVTLSVSTANRRALALYLNAGFEVDDVKVCWEASVVGG